MYRDVDPRFRREKAHISICDGFGIQPVSGEVGRGVDVPHGLLVTNSRKKRSLGEELDDLTAEAQLAEGMGGRRDPRTRQTGGRTGEARRTLSSISSQTNVPEKETKLTALKQGVAVAQVSYRGKIWEILNFVLSVLNKRPIHKECTEEKKWSGAWGDRNRSRVTLLPFGLRGTDDCL